MHVLPDRFAMSTSYSEGPKQSRPWYWGRGQACSQWQTQPPDSLTMFTTLRLLYLWYCGSGGPRYPKLLCAYRTFDTGRLFGFTWLL